MKTGKPTSQNAKTTFGNRKKGKAKKRENKRTSTKPSRGQG